jgi:hypothetical protein
VGCGHGPLLGFMDIVMARFLKGKQAVKGVAGQVHRSRWRCAGFKVQVSRNTFSHPRSSATLICEHPFLEEATPAYFHFFI